MSYFSNLFESVQNVATYVEETATAAGQHVSEVANQAYEAAAPTINDVTQNIGEVAGYTYATIAEKANQTVDYVKGQTQALRIDSADLISLDEVGRKIASLGAPAIAFAVAASIAGGMGLAGGAVITAALAMLGGPFGMIGGLMALGVLTAIADPVGKYGIEAVLTSTFQARREQGVTNEDLFREVDDLWISQELKLKIKNQLNVALK